MRRGFLRGALALAVIVGFSIATDHATIALIVVLWVMAIIAAVVSLRLAVNAPYHRPVTRHVPDGLDRRWPAGRVPRPQPDHASSARPPTPHN